MTNRAAPREDADAADAADAARVYVGNLKPKANESHITQAFARFGAIQSVWVARKPPGFAFVAFERESDAIRAVHAYDDAHPLEILGKRVKVQLAGEKASKQAANKAPETTHIQDDAPGSIARSGDHYGARREGHRRSRSRSRSRSMDRRHRVRASSPRRRRRSRSHSTSRSPISSRRHDGDSGGSRRHRGDRSRSRYTHSSSRTRRSRSRSASRSRSKSPSHRHRRRS